VVSTRNWATTGVWAPLTGIEQGGEGQAHLQAHELAGQFHGGEHDAKSEAQGRADGDLLQQDQDAVAGNQGSRC
jgi:hypothetical protein